MPRSNYLSWTLVRCGGADQVLVPPSSGLTATDTPASCCRALLVGLTNIMRNTSQSTLVLLGGVLLAGQTACRTPQPAPPDSPQTQPASQPASGPASRPASMPASGPSAADREGAFLSQTRQLIFEGRRSGRRLLFRRRHKADIPVGAVTDNPFYQIYRLDLETGDVDRVSPGAGKTTCSWVHPDGRRYLFASTHEDPKTAAKMKAELDFRASGKKRRYAWDYDEHYDLFVTKGPGRKGYRNLTRTRGYDAEASFSPDGRKIAFSSNRRAYTETMSDADRAAFERDKAYMMDIYIMNADGSGGSTAYRVAGL